MKDDYYLMEPPPVEDVEACPCCGSSARVWVYSEDPTMPVTRVVMCDHSDSIGPRDSLVYEGCLLQMPPDDFYRETGRDAVRYWNEYAKALTAAQRANRWNTSQVLRGPQSDIAAAAHAQGLRERISELEAQLARDELSPEFTDTSRAALLWVLWHHQGGSSPVGQPLRFALGMGAHDHLNENQIAEAKRWAEISGSTTADFHKHRELEAQRVPQWISVTERMPEPDSGEVLAWLTVGRCDFDEWNMHRKDPTGMSTTHTIEMGLMWRDYEYEDITHWMPLPPPPVERAHGIEEAKR